MSAVARRYAKAVFVLARDAAQAEAVGQQLTAAANLLAEPSLATVIASPLLSPARRAAIVDAVSDQLALVPLVANFLRVLGDHGRLGEVPSVADHFQRIQDQALGRVRMVIRTPTPLPEEQRTEIVKRFERGLGKTVIPRVEMDPALLGGVVVEAEGRVHDGSVRTHIERLRRGFSRSDSHS